jgi:hypothetical protein
MVEIPAGAGTPYRLFSIFLPHSVFSNPFLCFFERQASPSDQALMPSLHTVSLRFPHFHHPSYLLVVLSGAFPTASAYAMTLNGTLVSIDDEDEWNFIVSTFISNYLVRSCSLSF